MARITVLGGNGYVGAAVVAEARKRGHDVTAVSRTAPSSPVAGADYVEGSVLDADVLEGTTAGSDVVLVALSPRGDMAGKVEGVVEELIARLAGTPTRLGYVGGASSLLAEEGGPRLWDVTKDHIPDEVKPEVQTGLDTFALCQDSPESLDWFYVSPPADFGSWLGTESKGAYVLGGDVLLRDADGASTISADDLALAILDEIETPAHRRSRFTAIS
ncbi:NAD(P)H-binding protein [Nocardioides cavernae]|uniref:NAD(P)H-binding protein n=1 Tax=Nocardioides cavernae TaxID=1921566 RepID=A0ABR8NCP5_9ACTN|nr:NAD(P)H-binding protein [Nocardioides cavernae]MBD3925381.1 NAD(P)H-binding protein [Nocardioides cavernae]MBM7514240.1 putative NADH-flavin reductase [Nocardioides cavernae]